MRAMETREVYAWPEFRAFVKRLGVDMDLPHRHLKITLDMECEVGVEVEFIGVDRKDTDNG